MTPRTIVTSQPDVECDVCARRLLRGEQPDVFIDAGRRRIVCELCAPRAAYEGWMRETDSQPPELAPARPRRGGSLLERLPAPFRVSVPFRTRRVAPSPAELATSPVAAPVSLASDSATAAPVAAPVQAPAEPPALHVSAEAPHPHGQEQLSHVQFEPEPLAAPAQSHGQVQSPSETAGAHEQPSAYLRDAVEVFNASEFPRRVAGVIRSLGAPLVTVRSAEHLASVVRIVVAWELCWYCYEVDLSEPVAEAQVIAQGTELAELAREDRVGNAAVTDAGALTLASA
ncbi:MAG TPA: hypothetical protein VED41_11550 [Solirubrobacteraceae bacterium]|nr:hypothetical protein [Solirubrobacteraceae bacterium]